MPGLKLELDPAESPLALVRSEDGKSGYAVLSPLKKTTPQSEPQWTSNIDTEGELSAGSKTKNIEVSPKIRIYGRTEKDFREQQLALERKWAKLKDEGGTLRIWYPDESWIDYEIRAVTGGERLFDSSFVVNWRTEDELTLICAPFGKGARVLAGEFSGSDRVLSAEIANVGGTAPALVEAQITSPGADIWQLIWGRESRNYSSAATAAALYQAKEMTPLGGAKEGTRTIEGKSGTPVVKQVLNPNWSAQLVTDIATGRLTHIGVYEVFAWINMPVTNNGEVGIGLDYGAGDLTARTSLAPIYFAAGHPRQGKVVRVSLGQVFLAPTRVAEPGWQGQINTRSTNAGDELDILAVGFRPLSEGNGRLVTTAALIQPASLLLRDEFNQKTAGALNGQTLAAAQSVSGPASPAAASSEKVASEQTVAWANFEGVKSQGGAAASVVLGTGPAPPTTYWLRATGFGFALPSTATVEGIVFEYALKTSGILPPEGGQPENYNRATALVAAIKGGVLQTEGSKMRGFYVTPTTFTYMAAGSPSDLFGNSWVYSDINAANWGAAFEVVGRSQTIEVDHVRATVYWTDSAGQKWVTSGDAVDIAVETTGHTAQRSEVNDANFSEGRWAVAGTTTASDVVVGVTAKHTTAPSGSASEVIQGTFARYTDINNFLYFGFLANPNAGAFASLIKRVGGTNTSLLSVSIPETTEWHTVRLQVDRRGRYFAWLSTVEGGAPKLIAAGQDVDLATGGALASGKSGFQDTALGAGAVTRNYDQFVVWVPPLQAVAYQGLGLTLASDRVERQGANGAWSKFTPEGDYPKLSPAGLENRKNRLVFIASPHDPDTMGVGFPTELKVAVYVTPRYRGVPNPT